MMKPGIATFLLFGVMLALGAQPARADESVDAVARRRFETGQRLSAEGKHLEAMAEFSAGYELSHRPLFLFNMAESARGARRLTRARELYERYLAEDPSGKLAGAARQRLAELPAPPPAPAPPAPSVAPPPPNTTAAPPHEEAVVARPELTQALPPPRRPLWKHPGLWAGVGVGVVVIAVAAGVGGYYGTRGGDGSCTGTCLEFRGP